MYHISDFKRYINCARLFQKKLIDKPSNYESFARIDYDVYDLLIKKLSIDNYFMGKVGDDKNIVLSSLNNFEYFINSRFEYESLRVKIPILKKINDKFDVYFLSLTNFINDTNILNYCLSVWVLYNNAIKINDIKIIHFNSKYIRKDYLDINELFIIADKFYNREESIKDIIFKKLKDYSFELNSMKILENSNLESVKRVRYCMKNGHCEYYSECFVDENNIEDNSILTLFSENSKYDMYKEGIRYLKDVDLNRIECNRKQYAQIMADNNGGLFVDKLALKSFVDSIEYPISFLDFEWDTYMIPTYEEMKTYATLPFQYSLHILDEKIIHKEFLGFDDCREEFIKKLLNDLPKKGSIVAYNGLAAEKSKLLDLALLFPKYQEEIYSICDRIVDLQLPFELGMVYDLRMRGHYSLKTIMNMIDKNSYENLEINKGLDAVYCYRNLKNIDNEEEKEKTIKLLKDYCSMDTYSMIQVYRWLNKMLNGEEYD